MPDFSFPGATHETKDPVVSVDVDPSNPIKPGTLTFRLVVVDAEGNESDYFDLDVRIVDTEKPVAVIDPLPPIPYGSSFELIAKQSYDPSGGTIDRYVWTRVF